MVKIINANFLTNGKRQMKVRGRTWTTWSTIESLLLIEKKVHMDVSTGKLENYYNAYKSILERIFGKFLA